MGFFNLFLPATAFLLSVVSLAVFYWIVKRCQEDIFLSTYYFLGLSLLAVMVFSASRIVEVLGAGGFNYGLVKDLAISYVALFLFGALWQSYETEICMPPDWMRE
ncbi:MAG: hypothetical protein ABEJ98_02135 [Candidatus Nanohaloarchaea archaeon]